MKTQVDISSKELIAGHPFFKGLNARFVQMLMEISKFASYDIGETIISEGGDADRFFLIHRGTLSLEAYVPGKGLITVQILGAGEVLGCSWLYPPYRWRFSAQTLEETDVTVFEARALREQAITNPEFGYELAYRVGEIAWQRLQATRALLVDFYGVTE